MLYSLVWFVYESEFGTNRAKTYIKYCIQRSDFPTENSHWNFSEISQKFHRNISEIILQHFSEFQWNLTKISVTFHWNFCDISLKFQWHFTEMLENYFIDISVKCQWNFTEIIHNPQDPNDKKINKQELFAMKNKQHLLQKLRYNTCICKLCPYVLWM